MNDDEPKESLNRYMKKSPVLNLLTIMIAGMAIMMAINYYNQGS